MEAGNNTIAFLSVFLGGFQRLRNPRRLRRRLRRQQLLHKLVLAFVDVAVFTVENQLPSLQREVSAAVDFLHERLVEELESCDVGGESCVGVPASEVTR